MPKKGTGALQCPDRWAKGTCRAAIKLADESLVSPKSSDIGGHHLDGQPEPGDSTTQQVATSFTAITEHNLGACQPPGDDKARQPPSRANVDQSIAWLRESCEETVSVRDGLF